MVRSLWVTPLVVMLAASGLARGQGSPYVHPAAGGVKEQFVTVQEMSKPGQKCKVLRTWHQANGTKAYLVQSVETGEKMTIVESSPVTGAPGSSLGAKFRAVSTTIFHWGPGREPPAGTPTPPADAVVVGSDVEPASRPAVEASRHSRPKFGTKAAASAERTTAVAPAASAPTPPTPVPSAPAASPYSPSPTRWAAAPVPAAPAGGLTTLVPADFKKAKAAPADAPAPKSGAIAALAGSKESAPGPNWRHSWDRTEVTKTMPAGRVEMPAPGTESLSAPVTARHAAKKDPLPHARTSPGDPLTDPARYATVKSGEDGAPKYWFNRKKGVTPAATSPTAVAATPAAEKGVRKAAAEKPASPYAISTLSAAVSVAPPPPPNPLPKLADPVPPPVMTTAAVTTVEVTPTPAPPPPAAPTVKPAPAAVVHAAKPSAPPPPAEPQVPAGMRSVLAAGAPELVGGPVPGPYGIEVPADEGNAFSPAPRPRPRGTTPAPAAAAEPPALVGNAFAAPRPAVPFANAFVSPHAAPPAPAAAPADYAAAAAPTGVPELLAVLRDALHPSEREWAADCLASCDWRRQPEAADGLAAAARNDPAPMVRAGCVRALARMKAATEPVVAAVQALQSDADVHVRQAAEQALPVLTTVRPVGAVMPR